MNKVKVRPAQPSELEKLDRVTHEAWGDRLSVEEFVRRESRLRAHPWAAAEMTTWVLESESGELLSSCESFRMRARLRGSEGVVHAFASVFTEERFRGQGHASLMLREVMARLGRAEPETLAFILYSDVGPAMYERLGFLAVPSEEWCFKGAELGAGTPVAAWHADAQATGLIEALYGRLADEALAVIPSLAQLDWHWERERIYGALLGRRLPGAHVARAGEGFAIWTADFKNEKLRALVFAAGNAGEARALVDCGLRMARELGLESVVIWRTPAADGLSAVAQAEARESSLAMVRPSLRLAGKLDPRLWREIPRAIWV